MKPEKTSLIKIGYHKERNKYFATFKVKGLNKEKIGRIIMYSEVLKHDKDRKLYINDNNVYITDFFEVSFFESLYPHMAESARQGVIPERVEPSILDIEVDLCMMEHDVDFSVRRAPDLIMKKVIEGVGGD